jgi:hypothetical protein
VSRRPNLIPTVRREIYLPEDLDARLTLELFSEAEGKVPYGASSEFLARLVREHFESGPLDLAPFAGTEPGAFVVRGRRESIIILEKTLKGELQV